MPITWYRNINIKSDYSGRRTTERGRSLVAGSADYGSRLIWNRMFVFAYARLPPKSVDRIPDHSSTSHDDDECTYVLHFREGKKSERRMCTSRNRDRHRHRIPRSPRGPQRNFHRDAKTRALRRARRSHIKRESGRDEHMRLWADRGAKEESGGCEMKESAAAIILRIIRAVALWESLPERTAAARARDHLHSRSLLQFAASLLACGSARVQRRQCERDEMEREGTRRMKKRGTGERKRTEVDERRKDWCARQHQSLHHPRARFNRMYPWVSSAYPPRCSCDQPECSCSSGSRSGACTRNLSSLASRRFEPFLQFDQPIYFSPEGAATHGVDVTSPAGRERRRDNLSLSPGSQF